MEADVRTFPTAHLAARTAAERFVAAAEEAIARRGRFLVALSGGSTPKPMYADLAADPLASRVEWPCVHVMWGDERCVPPDDPASNYRLAREVLLDRVWIPPENVHRIRGEQDPARAAAAYERELRQLLAGDPLDLVLLGLGQDGHTASLFPGSPAIGEENHWVMAVPASGTAHWAGDADPGRHQPGERGELPGDREREGGGPSAGAEGRRAGGPARAGDPANEWAGDVVRRCGGG